MIATTTIKWTPAACGCRVLWDEMGSEGVPVVRCAHHEAVMAAFFAEEYGNADH